MDVAEEVDIALIDLADDNLHFELKGITYAHNKTDLITLMTHNTMNREYTEKMPNQTLNKAYQKHALSHTVLSARKERNTEEGAGGKDNAGISATR